MTLAAGGHGDYGDDVAYEYLDHTADVQIHACTLVAHVLLSPQSPPPMTTPHPPHPPPSHQGETGWKTAWRSWCWACLGT